MKIRFEKSDLAAAARVHSGLVALLAETKRQTAELNAAAERELSRPTPNVEQCEAIQESILRIQAVLAAVSQITAIIQGKTTS